MKVKIVNRPIGKMTVIQMKPGQLGVDDKGLIFFRTMTTATCLTHPERTYTNLGTDNAHEVTILLPGTKIELEVE